jgi:selenocysteine lyase/cysteine desulfurase
LVVTKDIRLGLAAEDVDVVLPDGRKVPFANLDYAATAPAALAAVEAVQGLLPWYGSVHRGAGPLSQRSTFEYERARQTVADFVGCGPDDHVVFTRNTTDALNLLAAVVPARTIAVTFLGEHHASLLPWRDALRLPIPGSPQEAVDLLGAALRRLRTRELWSEVPAAARRPVLVTVTAASNVTGELWPVAELAATAHRYGARLAVDAAQLAPHQPVDLAGWGADYVALSGHKLYAPFGVGVLAGRADWLDQAPPYLAGGGATRAVADDASDVDWATGPGRHEAGTPNALGVVALAAVCAALDACDRTAMLAEERDLSEQLRAGLASIPGVAVLRSFDEDEDEDADRVGIVSFAVAGRDSAELASWLGREHGIGVRDGLFCAHPLSRHLLGAAARRTGLDLPPTAVRASLGLGTRVEHIERLVSAVAEAAAAARQEPQLIM